MDIAKENRLKKELAQLYALSMLYGNNEKSPEQMKAKLKTLLQRKGLFDILSYVYECDKMLKDMKRELDDMKAANELSSKRKSPKISEPPVEKVRKSKVEDDEIPLSPNKVFELLQHIYPSPIITITLNAISSGKITNTQSIRNEFFHIIESSQLHLMPNIQGELQAFENVPHVGSLVVLDTPEGRFRAMRVPLLNDEIEYEDELKIYLLDTGELIHIPRSYAFFEMPEEYKLIPSLALLCRLSEPTPSTMDFIENSLLEDIEFQVVKLEKSPESLFITLHVKLVPKSFSTVQVHSFSSTNPFLPEINAILENQRKFGLNKDTLTQEQLDILALEPLSTENPQLAVLGYDPKDDGKYCRFTDASGVCFKGARCRFRHLPAIGEGWTRDQVKVVIDIPLKLEVPEVDSAIWLEPIVVLSVNKFYAYQRSGKLTAKEVQHANTALNQLVQFMNEPQEVEHLKVYKFMPHIDELVVCLFEGVFYRAKIFAVDEGDCVVHLVDYGNRCKIPFKDLRQWSNLYSYLPFQAIEITIENLRADPQVNQKDATAVLAERILNKQMQALVVQNIGDITVRLYDDFGEDVGENMVELGLAKSRSLEIVLSSRNNVFPQ